MDIVWVKDAILIIIKWRGISNLVEVDMESRVRTGFAR